MEFRDARRAGDDRRARLARAELAGRLASRSTAGRLTSGAASAADTVGAGNWFFDTATHISRLMGGERTLPREEMRALRRGLRNGMRDNNPVGTVTGAVAAGAAGGGVGASRALAANPGLALREGQRIANVGRTAALAAAGEAPLAAARAAGNVTAGEATPGEAAQQIAADVGIAGGFGGALNAAGSVVAPTLRGTGRWVGLDQRGVNMLARRTTPSRQDTRAPSNTREQRAARAAATTGTELRAGSVIDEIDAREVARLAGRSPRASATLAEGARDEADRLQTAFQGAVERAAPGVERVSAAELAQRASDASDAAMAAIENRMIRLPPQTVDILRSPGVAARISQIPDPVTGLSSTDELLDAMAQAENTEQAVAIPLRLLENVRSSITNTGTIANPGDNPQALRTVARHLRDLAGKQVPEYEDYLVRHAKARARVGSRPADSGETPGEGFQAGRGVLSEEPEAFAYGASREGPSAAAGRREGAVSALSEAASVSPSSALRVAERVSNPASVAGRNVRTALGPDGAESLRDAGRAVTEAAEAQRRLAPSTFPVTAGAAERSNRRLGAAAAVQGVSRGGAGFLVGIINELVDAVSAPPGLSARLARALTSTDPTEARALLREMDKAGIDLNRFNEIASRVAPALVVGSRAAGGAAFKQPEQQEQTATAPAQAPAYQPQAATQMSTTEVRADLKERALEAANAGDMETARIHVETHDRLERLENMALEAANSGDMEGARALVEEYDRILLGER